MIKLGPFCSRGSTFILQPSLRWTSIILWVTLCAAVPSSTQAEKIGVDFIVEASATGGNTNPAGAVDGDRFSIRPESVWQGPSGVRECWWSVRFGSPRKVGSILQINGTGELSLRQAPKDYRWQWSPDGIRWEDLSETHIQDERRMFRIHRLKEPRMALGLRLLMCGRESEPPVLREVEFYPEPDSAIPFPDWAVIIFTEIKVKTPPDTPHLFVNLIRECPEWRELAFQQICYRDVDEAFVSAEPRPLCAFLTGSGTEWCQVPPETWRGVEEVLRGRRLPIWGACGGAQVLALIWEHGTNDRWDCPRCRDPQSPRSPVYTHIGHLGPARCGDYSQNIGERGKYQVRLVAQDPAFEGLPQVFEVMEAHYGQIAYVPNGWVQIVKKGPQGLTENQCLRMKDRYIYAAQFHIELPGTPENSRRIISNFLRLAKDWGGYNPEGKEVPTPEPMVEKP